MSGRARVFLLEVAFVLLTIASVTAVAVPKRREMHRRQQAAMIFTDMEALRGAVYAFYSDSAYFPGESPAGVVPEGLEPYLPPRFVLRRPWGEMHYRNWPLPANDSPIPASNVVGVTVTTADPLVGAMAADRAATMARFTLRGGTVHTFLLFGS